ncbi:arsenate reductase/protein-tyrosine-phosphatase family protein [Geodermatophilus sp. SYSU D00815]
MDLLFVCTGNICRSAAAELLTANKRTPGPTLRVRSAGTHARAGRRIHPLTAAAVEPWGIDVSSFRSTPLGPEHVERADLILTMTTQHRQDVLGLSPYRMRSVYTLREAAALLENLHGHDWAHAPDDERGEALSAALTSARARLRGGTAHLDIVDPIDQPAAVHRQVVEEIADSLNAVLAALDAASPAPVSGPKATLPPMPYGRPNVGEDTARLPRLPPVPPMGGRRRP